MKALYALRRRIRGRLPVSGREGLALRGAGRGASFEKWARQVMELVLASSFVSTHRWPWA